GALSPALRRQRDDADDGHDRRSGSAHADRSERRVLPRAEDAQEGNAAGADARRIPRLAPAVASAPAAAVPARLVRQAQTVGRDDDIVWRVSRCGEGSAALSSLPNLRLAPAASSKHSLTR